MNHFLSRIDTEGKEQTSRKLAAAAILRRLDPQEEDGESNEKGRRPRKEDLVLTQYEQMIAMDVVAPEDIPVTFEGRFGLLEVSWLD